MYNRIYDIYILYDEKSYYILVIQYYYMVKTIWSYIRYLYGIYMVNTVYMNFSKVQKMYLLKNLNEIINFSPIKMR